MLIMLMKIIIIVIISIRPPRRCPVQCSCTWPCRPCPGAAAGGEVELKGRRVVELKRGGGGREGGIGGGREGGEVAKKEGGIEKVEGVKKE